MSSWLGKRAAIDVRECEGGCAGHEKPLVRVRAHRCNPCQMEGEARSSRLVEPSGVDVIAAFEIANEAVAEVERDAAYSVQRAWEGEQDDMLIDPCEEADECGEEGGEEGLEREVGATHDSAGGLARRGEGICDVWGRFCGRGRGAR